MTHITMFRSSSIYHHSFVRQSPFLRETKVRGLCPLPCGGEGGGRDPPPKKLTQASDDVPYFRKNWKPIIAVSLIGAVLEICNTNHEQESKIDLRKLEEKMKSISILLGMSMLSYMAVNKIRSN